MYKEIIRLARQYRDGAHTRVVLGGDMSDNGYNAVWDDMFDDAIDIADGDVEAALYVRAVFYRAAKSGARMARRRQPLPGQDSPSCW